MISTAACLRGLQVRRHATRSLDRKVPLINQPATRKMLIDASNVSVRAWLLHSSRKVDKTLRKYKGRYKELFKKLDAKYNRVKSVSVRANTQTDSS